MLRSTIIDNPVNMKIDISKAGSGWNVTPSLTAFPKPDKPTRKDIKFVLDCSPSMAGERLIKVKKAVKNLLGELTPSDRFSIVPFDHEAVTLVKRQRATKIATQQAEVKIDRMNYREGGGTDFQKAFQTVCTSRITGNSTIIFLTDGDDQRCTINDLLKPFHDKNIFPHVIPIGINLEKEGKSRQFLNDLFKASGGIGEAIFIEEKDNTDAAYQRAFDKAFAMAQEHSEEPVQLEMTIEAQEEEKAASVPSLALEEKRGKAASKTDEVSRVKTDDSRKLNTICYDGKTPVLATQHFAYSIPPSKVKLRFHCDEALVEAEYMLTPNEKSRIKAGQYLSINIPLFKWKNYSNYSWAVTLGHIFLGSLLLGSVAMSALSSPHLSLWAWKTLIENALICLAGLYLFFKGLYGVARKTIFLPKKLAATQEFKEVAEEKKNDVSKGLFSFLPSFEELKEDLEDWVDRLPPYLTAKNILTGSGLAVIGATAGYFWGTTSAASILIPAHVSASLFIKICAVAGGIALPLLAYGCWRFYSFASNHPKCPTKETLTYSTLSAVGGAAGYCGSKISAVSASLHGLSPFLLKVACSAAGAVALPVLAHICWRLYSFANTHPNAPSRKTLAYGTLFAASSAAGYWGSKTSVASAFIPHGVSPFLFSMGCTVLGAAAFALFAYGCVQLYNGYTVVQPAYSSRR